jgi:Domain of Unknown Function (DUF1259)
MNFMIFSRDVDLRRKTMKRTCLFFLLSVCVCVIAAGQQNATWKSIDDGMGRQGQDQPDGTRRFGMPRSDLKVTANGVELKAGFALGSWAAFRNMGNHMDVMGDLVLTESEVGPVMQKLVESGFEITALHNHLLLQRAAIRILDLIRNNSTALWVTQGATTAGYISILFREPKKLRKTGWPSRIQWVSLPESIFSRPAEARLQSLEISFSRRKR